MTKHQGRYSIAEERFNWMSHFLGLLLSISGGLIMLMAVQDEATFTVRVSVWVYMISLFTLYLSSSLYHYVSVED